MEDKIIIQYQASAEVWVCYMESDGDTESYAKTPEDALEDFILERGRLSIRDKVTQS